MRHLLVMAIILLMLASPVLAGDLTRNMQASFSGDIEYNSQSGSDVAEGVVDISGTGEVSIENSVNARAGSYEQDVAVEFTTGEGPLDSLDVTVGIRLNQSNEHVYVTRVSPDPGEGGMIEQQVQVQNDEFRQLILGHQSEITAGVYQRYVNLQNEEISLREIMKVVGTGWMKDHIRFEPHESE